MLPDKEMREFIYGLGIVVATFVFYIYNIFQYKHKKASRCKLYLMINEKVAGDEKKQKLMFFLSIVELVICSAFLYVPTLFNVAFGRFVGTGANYFGLLFLAPISLSLSSFLLWNDPLKQADISTPGLPLALVFMKITCFTSGCCHGVWWPGGPYSYRNEREEFPIQLVEAAVALALFFFLLWYKKRAKTGTVLPVYTILYSSIRFITEFWRGQELVWRSLRVYHFFCIIGFVVGVIELIVVLKYGDKISKYFENTFYFSRKRNQKLKEKEVLKT